MYMDDDLDFDMENIGIKDDPDVNPSSLRFRVGDLVLYKEEDGWYEAEIVKVCQRLFLPSHSQFLAYIVWPNKPDVDGTQWVEHDTDDFIRPRPDDLTPDPAKVRPHLVCPSDPHAFLYTGVTNDPCDKDGNSMAEAFKKLELVDEANINPDGSIRIKSKGVEPINTATIYFPKEPIHGVPGHAVFMAGMGIHLRSNIKDSTNSTGVPDPIGIFKSSVPSESSLRELEKASKTSHYKMLQLGDALMSGVHGWKRDPIRACSCYRAAALGCQENEEKDRAGVAVGIPEAMVAVAYVDFTYIKRDLMGLDIFGDNVSFSDVICYSLNNERAMNVIYDMIYWASMSTSIGWISPFVLKLAHSLKQTEFLSFRQVDDEFRELCNPLLKAHECRNKEAEYEKMQEEGRIPMGDPSDSTIELFCLKAKLIFCNLPKTSESIHIEYREVPRHPFPFVIYVIVPAQKAVLKVLKLPEALQISPYSQEAFEYAWLRIAFAIHLGKPGNRERTRPSIFTVLNSHGNREFASYLSKELSGSNTQIKLVLHTDKIKMGRKKRSTATLGDIIRDLENSLLEIPGLLYESQLPDEDVVSGAQREFVRHYMRDFIDMAGNDRTQDLAAVEEIKAQGKTLFASKDFNGASRRYSVAIQILSHFVEHDQTTYQLLGTLLCNRAACYLEIESQMSNVKFRKFLAQNAIKDCLVALESSWASTALSQDIIKKLKFRRDKASARYDALSSEFDSMAPILFPNDHVRNTNEETHNRNEDNGGQRRRRRGKRDRWHEQAETAPEQSSVETEQVESNDQDTKVSVRQKKSERGDNEALMAYGKILYDNRLARNAEDGCPICIREFSGELAKIHTAVLACGEHALCVECICNLKKEADKARAGLSCPLCRTVIEPNFVENLAYQIIEVDQELAMLVSRLPVDEMSDRINVAHRLLWSHDFRVENVVDVLESMLDDQVRSLFFRDEVDLTHKQKEDIYRQARRPVEVLKERVTRLIEERRTTFEINRLNKLEMDVRTLRSDLAAARRNAREEIYSRLNSVGTMGAQQDSAENSGIIQIDFHGLHIGEMQAKFSEHVKPVLPVVKKVTIITGRGLHSSSGESKLRKSLIKRIEQQENDIRWEKIEGNPGALNVLWKPSN